MKPKIKIIQSQYYAKEITEPMLRLSKKMLEKEGVDFDNVSVPGSFEIPYEIARSIKEDIEDDKNQLRSFEGKNKKEIRENIIRMSKLSQMNLNNQPKYSGYLALGCIIKGKTINHEAISTVIFNNLQRISIENVLPIGNGIFNANNFKEACKKYEKCARHAVITLLSLINWRNYCNEKKD